MEEQSSPICREDEAEPKALRRRWPMLAAAGAVALLSALLALRWGRPALELAAARRGGAAVSRGPLARPSERLRDARPPAEPVLAGVVYSRSGAPVGFAAAADPRLGESALTLEGGQRSEAFIENAPVYEEEEPEPASPAPERAARRPEQSVASQAAPIRYGANDRSELMGRGAGPVYNLAKEGQLAGADAHAQAALGQVAKKSAALVRAARRDAKGAIDPKSERTLDEAEQKLERIGSDAGDQ